MSNENHGERHDQAKPADSRIFPPDYYFNDPRRIKSQIAAYLDKICASSSIDPYFYFTQAFSGNKRENVPQMEITIPNGDIEPQAKPLAFFQDKALSRFESSYPPIVGALDLYSVFCRERRENGNEKTQELLQAISIPELGAYKNTDSTYLIIEELINPVLFFLIRDLCKEKNKQPRCKHAGYGALTAEYQTVQG